MTGRFEGSRGGSTWRSLAVEDGDSPVLMGHWREGVIPASGRYTLRSREGEVTFMAEHVTPPSESSAQRGQLRLRVVSGLSASDAVGCVWGSG
jgi:hypothetical protein